MRVLVISNMWPGPLKPYFGVSVETRVQAYERAGTPIVVVAIDDPRSGLVRNVVKYCRLLIRSVIAALRFRPDIIEGHYLRPTAVITWVVAALIRRPFVVYAHGSDVELGARWSNRPVARAVRQASEVHTNSEQSAERLAALYRNTRIRVIPPGVDLGRFEIGPLERESVVFFAGNLVAIKGVDVLIDALALLSTSRWRCRIAGMGVLESSLRARALAAGLQDRIEWLGPVSPDQMPALYQGSQLFVQPSRRESLGLAAVEALASGTPVVVTDVGGLASVPDERCGSVVPSEDPRALAEAIDSWLTTPVDEELARSARGRALMFSADSMAEQSLAALKAIVSRAERAT